MNRKNRRAAAEMEEEIKKNQMKLIRNLFQVIQAIARAVEVRDPFTAGHQRRVASIVRALAQEMELPAFQEEGLDLAAQIHDIGKLCVPYEILAKAGTLTDTEMAMVRTHSRAGYDILNAIDFPWPIAQIILQHHERLDGSGYPVGLSNGLILLEARILGVADVVEAMASHRPYRPALRLDAALDEIRQKRGVLYDGSVVDACVRHVERDGFRLAAVEEELPDLPQIM